MREETIAQLRGMLEEQLASDDALDARASKRARIVEVATDLFATQGYRKTNVAEIAQAAGVAKGTVYLYFDNKADLLVAAIAAEKRRFFGAFEGLLAPELDARERLRGWLSMVFTEICEMRLTSRLMSGDREIFIALAEINADLRDRSEELQHAFVRELIDDAAAGNRWSRSELDDRAQVVLGLAYSAPLLTDQRVRGHLALDRYVEILVDALVAGLCGPEASQR